MAKETLEALFSKLQEQTNETKGLVFTQSFGKKSQMWGFYVFSTKKKIENKDLNKALSDTIKYIDENRVKDGKSFKMK